MFKLASVLNRRSLAESCYCAVRLARSKHFGKLMKWKLVQYADDLTAFLSDLTSTQNLFKLLDRFGKLSGLEVLQSDMHNVKVHASEEVTIC